MDCLKMINRMKEAGVYFSSGLTNDMLANVEKTYEICFPDSLKEFYLTALPISFENTNFPRWDDFSPKNIAVIRQRISAPYQWLKQDIERGFWLPAWDGKTIDELFENAPKIIPIYSHRYAPMLNYANPPVISTVGRDAVCYGVSLEDYLLREFCNGNTSFAEMKVPYIPLWSDIFDSSKQEARNCKKIF